MSRPVIALCAVIVLGLLGFVADRTWFGKHRTNERPVAAATPGTVLPTPASSEKTVAVLPFIDISEKKDQEYFADGMAEEIIDLLAKIPSLTVIGRTSSFQFKGKSEDLRTIGTKLRATHVVEGSVRTAGDHVRVTAQLIDTRTDSHEWSGTFDRNIGDVLELQDEIAAGLVRALEVTIGADDLRPRGIINNTEAYQFYLKGRHAFDRHDKDGDDESAADFQKALDLEPTFAEAAGYLAMTRADQAMNGFMSYPSGFKQARVWAETAVRQDPSSSIGHSALTDYYIRFAWDWEAADREAKRARVSCSRFH